MKIHVFCLVIFHYIAGSKKIEPGSKIMHVRDDSKKLEALHVWEARERRANRTRNGQSVLEMHEAR